MQDVKHNRHLYIGGSDLAAIMNLSPFKSRFDLLLEKAELKENDFQGNEYTEYGNVLEPIIRDYINNKYNTEYLENKVVNGVYRYHSDGFNGESVLEIKTTSQIKKTIKGYKIYLVQLLFGMYLNKVEKGLLVVYKRPKDFNTDFDAEKLQEFKIELEEHKELLNDILIAVKQFEIDLDKVKADPFIKEEEL